MKQLVDENGKTAVCYKLTNEDNNTYNGTQWGPGISHETDGTLGLCGPGWLHYYDDPLLAVLLNPIHGNFSPRTMRLWKCLPEGKIKEDSGKKFGCTKLTTLEQIAIPEISTRQKAAFGILCALEVYDKWENLDKDKIWYNWAKKWLSGTDNATTADANIAYGTACIAVQDANNSPYTAAHAAAHAAYGVAHSDIDTASGTAYAVAYAADYATCASMSPINLKSIAKKAMEF
jgi:hypothetical protein